MWHGLIRRLAMLFSFVGVVGLPDHVKTWWNMLTVLQSWLDIWAVRAALLIVFGLAISYPQWTMAIRKRLDLRDEHTLWYGIQWWWHWRQIERAEDKKRKQSSDE